MKTNEFLGRVENGTLWINDIILLIKLHNENDVWATNKLLDLVKKIEEYPSGEYHQLRPLIIYGFEPSFTLVNNFTGIEEEPWGDYFNEFFALECNEKNFEDVRKVIGERPIWRYEERYFLSFYDIKQKVLKVKEDERVKRLNHIADEINKTYETITFQKFQEFYKEVIDIIYNNQM